MTAGVAPGSAPAQVDIGPHGQEQCLQPGRPGRSERLFPVSQAASQGRGVLPSRLQGPACRWPPATLSHQPPHSVELLCCQLVEGASSVDRQCVPRWKGGLVPRPSGLLTVGRPPAFLPEALDGRRGTRWDWMVTHLPA